MAGVPMGAPSKELLVSYLVTCRWAPKLKILFWISLRKPSRIEKETIMMARPMAMLIIAIFVTEAVKDCDPVSDIFLEI
jgi:hypothetical protein